MSNEVKIGLLAIVAIGLSFWGFKFIMGKNALSASNLYYVEYTDVEGLQKATPVRLSGLQVGIVSDLYLKPEDPNRRVTVVLDLNKDMQIPKNTKAIIISTSVMGGKAIDLEYSYPCSGTDCAKSGDYLQGETRGLLASMLSEDQAKSYVDIFKNGMNEIIDTINNEFLDENSNSPIALSLRDLRYTMGNLRTTSSQLDVVIQRSSRDIEGTLKNLNSVTGTLQANNDKIKNIIYSADNFASDLAEADLQNTISKVKVTIDSLQVTLGSANGAIKGVSSAINRINMGEGTLGKLMQDDSIYVQLRSLTYNLDSLSTDIKERPYRYIPLKSRLKVKRFDRLDAKDAAIQNEKLIMKN